MKAIRAVLCFTVAASVTMWSPSVAEAAKVPEFIDVRATIEDHDLEDAESNADDLAVAFTEVGYRRDAVNVEVKAVRDVTATCISAFGSFPVEDITDAKTLTALESHDPEGSATFTSDQDRSVSGVVHILTTFPTDICPRYDPNDLGDTSTAVATVYLVSDYTITYRDITITDIGNGATATLEPVGPAHFSGVTAYFVVTTESVGFACTVSTIGSGQCGAY